MKALMINIDKKTGQAGKLNPVIIFRTLRQSRLICIKNTFISQITKKGFIHCCLVLNMLFKSKFKPNEYDTRRVGLGYN